MEFEEDFPEFEDDEGRFALMGSELMGGAPLPVNMTPQEKQSYMDGIGIKAKYIGVTEVSSARGGDDVLLAIARVRAAHKAFREAKQRTWLVISVSGLKIRDFDTRQLRDSYALYQISYATWLPSNPQVFAFITANTTTSPPIYKCHVYKSHSKSKMIIETFGRCFTLAVEMQRTGLTRAVRMKDASFHEVVRDIRRQLQSTRVPLDIAAFCNEGLKRLTHLYDQECNSDPHNDAATPNGTHVTATVPYTDSTHSPRMRVSALCRSFASRL
ncbi:hypothetical protein PTSG_07005 [Salpingoeca rosetta]|uniref:PID domain-containing protein n=1 Tax=Salpingoeca rosetta (strain ATCC 50818 / BSB-021) TaxID=946362 RepID=F2UDR9_SALR5|nr:uncharacterized protein PTSG_07005 [Salpingoeca rosetta]EGD74769.1 hypothetical protein PTSG_07005 [Salpingoeca rosetta]|eukprot:XP_004992414.1 hypothetical protein PTSG_07005 [Salpingoeca rosetta]